MTHYTLIEAIIAVVAGIWLAVRTKKSEGVVYGKLDKAGRITNIILIPIYVCLAPFYMLLGMLTGTDCTGLLGVLGWIVSALIASTALVCGLGLGFSVALRKKGKSKLSFAVQFAGFVGIALCVGLYCLLAGNLLRYLN